MAFTVKKFRKYTDILFRTFYGKVPSTCIPCVYGNPQNERTFSVFVRNTVPAMMRETLVAGIKRQKTQITLCL